MADDEMANTSEKIAENVLLLAIARMSMALVLPVVGLIAFLGSQWLDSRFETQAATVSQRIEAATVVASRANNAADRANDVAGQVNNRLIAVETKQVQEASSNERFQNGTLNRLDRVQDSIVGLSNAVAALTATLQAMVENRERDRILPPSR